MILGLLTLILVLAVSLLVVYVIADVRSHPIESVKFASSYRKLSEQIVQLIHDPGAQLKDIPPLMVEWANMDAKVRGHDPVLKNQVGAVFLMHGYPIETTRREITEYIRNAGATPRATSPLADQGPEPGHAGLTPTGDVPPRSDEVPKGVVIH
jgi:hypothetical protein